MTISRSRKHITSYYGNRVSNTNIKWNSIMDMGQLDVSQIESTPDLMDFIRRMTQK